MEVSIDLCNYFPASASSSMTYDTNYEKYDNVILRTQVLKE